MNVRNVASWLVIISLVILLLIYGQPIIVPFIIALLIWFVIKKVRNLINKIHFIEKYIPEWVKTILSSILIFTVLLFGMKVLISNIQNISESYGKYISNIEHVALQIDEMLNINMKVELSNFVREFDFTALLQQLFNSLSETLGNMVMISFYVVFMMVEETLFQRKIRLILPDSESYTGFLETMKKVDKSMSRYISLKSMVNMLSAGLSYIVLASVGIDSPLFWAFLIFIFSFIPSIGPILGSLLPSLFTLIQFGEFVPFLIVLFGVGTIALLIGSLVEPRLMGNTLNISPLVAILSLAVWGTLWGITGMLLSVPITVALIIILSQFPATKPMAILLSEKGRL
jgi:predicted PurR-regulated permease PerM